MSYDAFISYDHADAEVAVAVQRSLHRIAKPLLRLRALRVFRDTTGLSPNEPLPDGIDAAIHASDFLILIASPDSATSPWVQKEVATMLERRRADRLILILAGGHLVWDSERNAFDPAKSTALAPQLHNAFEREPLWIDLRDARSESRLTLRNPAYRTALVAVAAPLHGKSPDQLDTDDHRLQRRLRRIVAGVALVLLAVSASWIRASVQRAREESIRRANELGALASAVRSIDLRALQRKGLLAVQALHELDEGGLRSADADEPLREVLSFLPRVTHTLEPGLLAIQSLAFTDDGSELVIAGRDTSIVRVGIYSGELDTIPRPGFYARSAALSPDGAFVVTAHYNPDPPGHWLVIHDAMTGELVDRVPGGRRFALAPGGRFLATVHDQVQRVTEVWDLSTHRIVGRLPSAASLSFSREGRHLALGGSRASLWRLTVERRAPSDATLEEVWQDRTLTPGGGVLFSADGQHFALTGYGEERLRINALSESGLARATVDFRDQPDALSRGGRFTAEASTYDIVVRETATGRAVRIPHGREISAFTFSPRDDLLAVAGIGGRLTVWELSDHGTVGTIPNVTGRGSMAFIGDTTRLVLVQGQSQPGSRFLGAIGSRVLGWRGESLVGDERSHRAGWLDLSPDGRYLAVYDSTGSLTIWSTLNGEQIRRIAVGADVRSFSLGEDARRVAVLLAGEIRVLDARTGNPIHTYSHDADAVAVSLSHRNATAWLRDHWVENPGTRGAREHDTISIVDVAAGKTLRTADLARRSAVVGPLGRRVAWQDETFSAVSPTVRVETLADSTMRSYPGSFGAFSSDGRYFATLDGARVRVWDLDGGEIARIPEGVQATPVLSSGARYLAVWADGTVRVWPLAPDELIRTACTQLGSAEMNEDTWTDLMPEVAWEERACA